jgi:hypothetical protein
MWPLERPAHQPAPTATRPSWWQCRPEPKRSDYIPTTTISAARPGFTRQWYSVAPPQSGSAWSHPPGGMPSCWPESRTIFVLSALACFFASEAAEELINIRNQLATLSATDAVHGVRQELCRRADSCAAVRPNGWRAATYRAWHGSDWFCHGGFAGVD